MVVLGMGTSPGVVGRGVNSGGVVGMVELGSSPGVVGHGGVGRGWNSGVVGMGRSMLVLGMGGSPGVDGHGVNSGGLGMCSRPGVDGHPVGMIGGQE